MCGQIWKHYFHRIKILGWRRFINQVITERKKCCFWFEVVVWVILFFYVIMLLGHSILKIKMTNKTKQKDLYVMNRILWRKKQKKKGKIQRSEHHKLKREETEKKKHWMQSSSWISIIKKMKQFPQQHSAVTRWDISFVQFASSIDFARYCLRCLFHLLTSVVVLRSRSNTNSNKWLMENESSLMMLMKTIIMIIKLIKVILLLHFLLRRQQYYHRFPFCHPNYGVSDRNDQWIVELRAWIRFARWLPQSAIINTNRIPPLSMPTQHQRRMSKTAATLMKTTIIVVMTTTSKVIDVFILSSSLRNFIVH